MSTARVEYKVLHKPHLTDSSEEAVKQVGVIVGCLSLEDGSQTLKTHTSVNVPGRQIQQTAIGLPGYTACQFSIY